MPSKEKDIKFLLNKLFYCFVYQDATNSNEYNLTEIIDFINSYK